LQAVFFLPELEVFFVNGRFLTTRRVALASLAALPLIPAFAATGLEVSAPDALAQLKAGKLILVDIRTPDEWKQTGVAQGAMRLDMQHPKGAPGFMDDLLKLTKGDKNAPVALICRTGNRTTQVQRYLEAQGFTQVFNVREGMAGSAAAGCDGVCRAVAAAGLSPGAVQRVKAMKSLGRRSGSCSTRSTTVKWWPKMSRT
jgi:rhodanese-related sulfurtransferase